MLKGLRAHARSNLVGYIALFFALGLGSAWAATELSRNSVGPKEIKKNAVRAAEIAKKAVRSGEVKNNVLKGRDVLEATFGQVPSAAQATSANSAQTAESANSAQTAESANSAQTAESADSVDGVSLERVFFKAAPNTPTQEIASLGVLQVNAGCNAAGNVVATVEPASGAPPLELKHEGEGSANAVFDDQNAIATPRTITFGGASAAGMVRVASTNGAVVTFDYGYDNAPTFEGENVCTLSGILVG